MHDAPTGCLIQDRAAAPTFSIVVLARNEARTLPRLLGSLRAFLDRGGEVLVADTGSCDDTVAIAKRHGCRVEEAPGRFDEILDASRAAEINRRFARADEGPLVAPGQRLFHFGDARQWAGQSAACRFVLQLDACDEALALDIDAFDRWIAMGADVFEYELQAGDVTLRVSRFYDRDRFRWAARVHEQLFPLGTRDESRPTPVVPTRCERSHLLVRHHRDETKARNYLAGLALQVLAWPKTSLWWFYLGRELFSDGFYRSAIATLEKHAAMADAWPAERSQSLCFAGQCLESLGQVEEAIAAYRRAMELEGSRREPLLRLAAAHSQRGEFETAAELASRSLALPRTCPLPELEANYTWKPHAILYWSLLWLGRRDEARTHWERYCALVPPADRVEEHALLFPSGQGVDR